MPPELSLFYKVCPAVSVPGTVPSLSSPSVQQPVPLPAFPSGHSTAPPSPQTPEGCNPLLKIWATSISFDVCKIRPQHTEHSHFCFASGFYWQQILCSFLWMTNAWKNVHAAMTQASLSWTLAAKEANAFCQAYLSTKELWQTAVMLVSSPRSAPLS